MTKRFISIILFLLTLALVVSCGGGEETAEDAGNYKLAAIFPGTITDADYNTLGNLGIEAVKANLDVETAFSESVAVPDVERVMREYIDDGFNIVFTHGGQFLSQTIALAGEFPDVNFIAEADATVEDLPENVWVIVRNMEVGAYGVGAVAAKMTQTGKIGYITGLTLPFTYAEFHAIEQAIGDLGLDVEVTPVWVGDFNDPSKARELADTLIAEDVDVIVSSLNLGTLGVFEAAEAAGPDVKVIAKYTDKSEFAPDNYVTSALYDFERPLTDIVTNILNGERGGNYQLSFETGIDMQLPLTNTSDEINSEAETLLNQMKSGDIEVIKDTTPVE
ncbi:MAG: BMP family protein [Ardenticatenaceae bacterium]|nr:BMP family protein [Anaerolineales bacterium]MCB8942041.1 BMP family protein [Ardenticatenaceae bacterium]MCB8973199.1 BMP family protein [Ardenticatenaceae bacterium]